MALKLNHGVVNVAIISKESKVILYYPGLYSFCFALSFVKNSSFATTSVNQSDAKLKLNANWSLEFFRA